MQRWSVDFAFLFTSLMKLDLACAWANCGVWYGFSYRVLTILCFSEKKKLLTCTMVTELHIYPKNNKGLTPLDLALEGGHEQLARYIHQEIKSRMNNANVQVGIKTTFNGEASHTPSSPSSLSNTFRRRSVFSAETDYTPLVADPTNSDDGEDREANDGNPQSSNSDSPLWTKVFDEESGFWYYFNSETSESTWEIPPGFIDPSGEANQSQQGRTLKGELTRDRMKLLVCELYRRVNPQKLDVIDAMLDERGSENWRQLLIDMEAKYNIMFYDLEKKRQLIKTLVTNVYEAYNPKKLATIERLLDERSPKYEELLVALEEKYRITIPRELETELET